MISRWLVGLAAALALLFGPSPAEADPQWVIGSAPGTPSTFRGQFLSCINQFKAAGGVAGTIISQLDGAKVTINYSTGGGGATDNPGGLTAGKPILMDWDPRSSGRYYDGASKVPCGVLLHELQHAARLFKGRECSGAFAINEPAVAFDEGMGVRAENWWIEHLRRTSNPALKQRSGYGPGQPLARWTRWPALATNPIPKQPRCDHECINFNQPGCFVFRGGIYSGGDHRRVAFGNLKIVLGPDGYCQDRAVCEFRNCVTCPHLDTAFPEGATVKAIATPGKDSRFARWGPGECQGQGPTCTFTARKNSCISAQFLLTNPQAPPQTLPVVQCPDR